MAYQVWTYSWFESLTGKPIPETLKFNGREFPTRAAARLAWNDTEPGWNDKAVILPAPKRSLTALQRRWVADVLSNDESSTDAELLAYFTDNGLSLEQADVAVGQREAFLRAEVTL